jgi:hypothetical protein
MDCAKWFTTVRLTRGEPHRRQRAGRQKKDEGWNAAREDLQHIAGTTRASVRRKGRSVNAGRDKRRFLRGTLKFEVGGKLHHRGDGRAGLQRRRRLDTDTERTALDPCFSLGFNAYLENARGLRIQRCLSDCPYLFPPDVGRIQIRTAPTDSIIRQNYRWIRHGLMRCSTPDVAQSPSYIVQYRLFSCAPDSRRNAPGAGCRPDRRSISDSLSRSAFSFLVRLSVGAAPRSLGMRTAYATTPALRGAMPSLGAAEPVAALAAMHAGDGSHPATSRGHR